LKLPNADLAIVERDKLIDYLLNAVHPKGASKARFFESFGFSVYDWGVLSESLRQHARENEVHRAKETGFGPRYEVVGNLNSPDGRNPHVLSVWQLDHGKIAPRLITAYPVISHDK
jgi:hypothetical protein